MTTIRVSVIRFPPALLSLKIRQDYEKIHNVPRKKKTNGAEGGTRIAVWPETEPRRAALKDPGEVELGNQT
jgi:hypothetical protein